MPRFGAPCRLLFAIATAAILLTGVRSAGVHADGGRLDLYTATVDRATYADLGATGYDLAGIHPSADRVGIDLVLSPRERALLGGRGIATELWRSPDGLTARALGDAQQAGGFQVWRSFDQVDGIRDELYELAHDNPDLVKLEVLGTSVQDREIIAVKVTRDAPTVPDGTRPAALYLSTQHAREWIGLEVNRRLLHYLVDRYPTDAAVKQLLDSLELWFVLVANPDGYEHTFTTERMWRKNLRDNDGDDQITDVDGVDPNRNYAAHWGYDNAGSSPDPADAAFRGAAPASEPETQAIQGLLGQVGFAFAVNFHSVASLILYPAGWQDQTATSDDAIFTALAGTPANPAIEGFTPLLSAGLYITNGETCDYAYGVGTLCYTVELSDQNSGGGFVFPDDEALVQAEFERVLPFSLDVARSTADPAHPVSHLGNTVQPFYVDTFALSYGDPQIVQVTAARDLGDVTMKFRVNDGAERTRPTREWTGGKRYDEVGQQYRKRRGEVAGARPGDRVTVWFEAGGQQSAPFNYTLASDTAAPVLVVAAEDYTGRLPVYPTTEAPTYLHYYLDALAANGVDADVYDVDGRGRAAPSPLGVLSHYRAVIWYTGDDSVVREPGMQPGTTSRLANDLLLAMREYLNAGGKILYTGKYAGFAYLTGSYSFDPVANEPCDVAGAPVACAALSPDFARYYLGLDEYARTIATPLDPENLAGTGRAWWSGGTQDLERTVERTVDLTGVAGKVIASFDAYWNMETHRCYGYAEAAPDGSTWESLPDMDGVLTEDNPNGVNQGWGLTGHGQARLRFDLSGFAGESVQVRLRYVPDRWAYLPGWIIDNLAVNGDAGLLYANDMENGFGDWTTGGWTVVPASPPPGDPIYPVLGLRPPFEGLRLTFGSPGAGNQDHSLSFTPTSESLPADAFPQFRSYTAAWFDDPATRAHSGDTRVDSGSPTYSFERLTRTVDLTQATTGTLSFWTSHSVWAPYDAIFVEARTAGAEDWTTLPETAGHTAANTSLNCATSSWYDRFPRLAHYMTPDGAGQNRTCRATGTTGSWYAATGNSGGWQAWSFDLSGFAGKSAEVSISFITSRQPSRGVLIDDVALSTGESTSFEDDWGGWTVEGAPPGSRVRNSAEFTRATLADTPSGPVVVTPDSITFGFGFEGIADDGMRTSVMERVLTYFGVLPLGPAPTGSTVYLPAASRESGVD
jgi:hypothetical protein